jgi:hypothetical protein
VDPNAGLNSRSGIWIRIRQKRKKNFVFSRVRFFSWKAGDYSWSLEILQGVLGRMFPFILVQDPDLDSVQPESRSKSAALPIITNKKKMCSPQQERSKTNYGTNLLFPLKKIY